MNKLNKIETTTILSTSTFDDVTSKYLAYEGPGGIHCPGETPCGHPGDPRTPLSSQGVSK